MNEIAAANLDPTAVNAAELAKVIAVKSELPREVYTNAISESADPGFSADRFLTERTTSDESTLEPAIEAVIAANPGQVETYRGGKEGVLGFLVGQVLKETQGKADPKVVNRLLREKLRA
jgi:aspartyl-tRNA(Asn)/glutamyl-tRNA(Gln) amidotransferase subunit B